MRVLIFHGYMLRGTGSNIYNANLARALARLGPRGPSALPGPRGRDRGRRDPQPRHRRPASRLRQRPLRGLRGQGLPGADRRGARPLHRGQRRRRARGRRTGRRLRRRPRQPPGHGPGDPRPRRRRPLRRQDPRLGARVHGQAAPAVPALCRRRHGSGRRASSSAPAIRPSRSGRRLPDVEGLREKTRLGPPGVDTEAFQAAGGGRRVPPGSRSRGAPRSDPCTPPPAGESSSSGS